MLNFLNVMFQTKFQSLPLCCSGDIFQNLDISNQNYVHGEIPLEGSKKICHLFEQNYYRYYYFDMFNKLALM